MNQEEASKSGTLDLLKRLKAEMPGIWGQALVVGKWVWLEFNVAPERPVRAKLRELGFHWNPDRHCWQHPCGVPKGRSRGDPREYYEVVPADKMALNDAMQAPTAMKTAKEFKVIALRECPLPEDMHLCDTPQKAADYWRLHIVSNPYYNPECECFAVLLLNTRRRVKGHQLLTIGTLDTILIHPREVFRGAIIAAAAAIVLAHNLCAEAHKLCYVARRFMCSRRSPALTLARRSRRKEGYV